MVALSPTVLRVYERILVLLVVTSLALGPLAPVFAQEGATSTESSFASDGAEPIDPILPMSFSSGGEGTRDREDVIGAGAGKVRDDINQGALVERISFSIPPGRNGLTPGLALIYNSQDLSDSPYGYGWQISIPSIERLNQLGTDRLYIDDHFTSSIGGELVPDTVSTTTYRHRIEDGSFISYQFQNNVWTAFDKNGTRYSFGTTTVARQSTTSPDRIYRWMLEEVRDTNDNFIKYEYTKHEGQIYPLKITYTGSGSTDGPFEIDFTYETRPDRYTSYKAGWKIDTLKRLIEVKASVNDEWRRKYTLAYGSGVNGSRSMLTSVQETGRDEAGDQASLPAMTFGYSSSTPQYASSTNPRIWNSARMVADIDGNGLPDRSVFWSNSASTSAHRVINENEYPTFNTTDTSVTSEYWSFDNTGLGGANDFPFQERGVRLLDLNGDGRADIARGYRDSGGNVTRTYYRSTSAFTWSNASLPANFPIFGCNSGTEDVSTGLFGNINGDYLVDYVATTTACSNVSGSYLNSGLETGWRVSSDFSPVTSLQASSTIPEISQFVDINGDGLDDWMLSTSTATVFYLNTGTGWGTVDTRWSTSTSLRQTGGWDKGVRFIDMNSDGLVDFVRSYYMPSYSSKATGVSDIETGTYNYIALNTGNGFATTTLRAPEFIFNGVASSTEWTGRVDYNEFVDWNGDSLPDSAGASSFVASSTTARADVLTYIGHSTGGRTLIEHKLTSQMASTNAELPFPVLVVTKVTKDDLFDNVPGESTETTTYGYEGGKIYFEAQNIKNRRFAGFSKVTRVDALGKNISFYHQGDTASTTIGELSDGFGLIGRKFREDVLNNASSTLKKSFYRWTSEQLGVATTTGSATTTIARGSSTFSNQIPGSSHSFSFTVGSNDNILVVIGDSQGSTFINSVTYNSQSLTQVGSGVQAGANRNGNLWYLINPPTGSHTLTVFRGGSTGWIGGHAISYSGVDTVDPFGTADSLGSIAAGSTTATVSTDVDGSWLVGFFGAADGSTHSVDSGAFRHMSDIESWDSNASVGLAGTKSVTYGTAGSGTMLRYVIPMSPAISLASATSTYWLTALASETIQDWEGGATHKDKATEYIYASSTGNVLQVVERGEVTGATNGTYSDTGSDKRTTVYTYSATTTRNLTLPTSKEVQDNSGSTVAKELYYYDSASWGTASTGNKTKDEKWMDGSAYSSTTKAYNSYGLVTSERDPRGGQTTYDYDALNLYPDAVTNALSQEVAYEYDYMIGKPKRVEDDNGGVRETLFDPLGRVEEEEQTNPSFPLTTVLAKDYLYSDTFPSSVRARTYFSSASTTETYSYRDGLGRVIQERTSAEESNRYSVKDYRYGASSMLIKETLPYFSTSSARTTHTGANESYTTYSYDALQRPIKIETSVGSSTYAYAPWETTVTDARSIPKTIRKDAHGNLLSVVEYDDASTYTTTYTHDSLNNLTGVRDALNNIRSFTYDDLSRRTAAQDLHGSSDSTFGTWNYAYDLANNLASTTDAKGQTVQYTFDVLNRKATEDYTGLAGTESTYTYDSCANGVGRLCVASSTVAKTLYEYDDLGNVTEEEKIIAGKSYTTNYTYDRRGAISTITLPDSVVTSYEYNPSGAIESVSRAGTAVVEDFDYGPHGKPVHKEFANGVETYLTYDEMALYRLTNILTAHTGGSISFNGFGNSRFSLAKLGEVTRELFVKTAHAQEIETSTSTETQGSSTENTPEIEATTTTSETPQEQTLEESSATTTEEVSVVVPEATTTEQAIEVTIPNIVEVAEEIVATSTASSTETHSRKVHEEIRSITPPETGSIRSTLEGKGAYRRDDIKGEEIAKRVKPQKVKRDNYKIEIVSIEPIKDGVQVFVRAWDDEGDQIGFGRDGTVDMERFRIFNPPILVPDERGDIREERVRRDESDNSEKIIVRTFREDPKEALLRVIEHNLSVMKNIHGPENIIEGKKGKTVSTFYPSSGESSPVDGIARMSTSTNLTWNAARSAAGSASCDTCVEGLVGVLINGDYIAEIQRAIFGFDTSSIGNSSISSAVLSITMDSGSQGETGFKMAIDRHDGPASSADIVEADYNLSNWDNVSQSDTAPLIADIDTRMYYNFPLNSTGINGLSTTSLSWLGLRMGNDVWNINPGSHTAVHYGVRAVFADSLGTTEDPRLMIEHSLPSPVVDADPSVVGGRLQNMSYTYDAVGNITKIIEAATTSLSRTVNYSYDDLSRLIEASGTTSTATFGEEYSYNALGNILEKLPVIESAGGAGSSTDLERGSNQYWSISDGAQTGLDFSNDLTLSMWTKLESVPPSGDRFALFHKWDDGVSNPRLSYTSYLYNDSGTYYLELYIHRGTGWPPSGGDTTGAVFTLASLPTGEWHHITLTKDDTTVTAYIDGSSLGTASLGFSNITNSNAPLRIGRGWCCDGNNETRFDGLIDDARVWSRTLSSGEVWSLYDDPSTFSNGSNLQGWWKFDGDGTDESSNNNDLSGVNSPGYSSDVPDTGGVDSIYSYSTTTGYQNPHAPISHYDGSTTTTYAYDLNGNLASTTRASLTTYYTWDWQNRLTNASSSATTSAYAYDHGMARVSETVGSRVFHYPNKHYSAEYTDSSLQTGTSTTYFWAGDTLVAYAERSIASGSPTGSATIYYVHPDHLENTNIVTNSSGSAVQLKDYMPYGSIRIESSTTDSGRGFIAQFENEGNDLNYLNARYYEGGRGQFLSQDPVFWELGLTQDGKMVLQNPQIQNSYSYAGGNPITLKDPSGRLLFVPALFAILSAYGWADTAVDVYEADIVLNQYPDQFTEQEKNEARITLAVDGALLFAPYTKIGGKLLMTAAERKALDLSMAGLDVIDHYSNDKINSNSGRRNNDPTAVWRGLFNNSSTDSSVKTTQVSNGTGDVGNSTSASKIMIDSGTRDLLRQLKSFMTQHAQDALNGVGI